MVGYILKISEENRSDILKADKFCSVFFAVIYRHFSRWKAAVNL